MREKEALLTKTQRKFLTGDLTYEGEYAKQQRYQRRKAIRERLRAGILDFGFLEERLERDERTKIVEGLEYGDAIEPAIGLVSWAYQICDAVGLKPEAIFAEGVARGVEARTGERPSSAELEFTIHDSIDHLYERYQQGDPTLTWKELDRIQAEKDIDITRPAPDAEIVLGEEDVKDLLEEERAEERDQIVDAIEAELEDAETLTVEAVADRLDVGIQALEEILREDSEEIASLLSASNRTGRSPAALELVEAPNVTEIHLVDAE